MGSVRAVFCVALPGVDAAIRNEPVVFSRRYPPSACMFAACSCRLPAAGLHRLPERQCALDTSGAQPEDDHPGPLARNQHDLVRRRMLSPGLPSKLHEAFPRREAHRATPNPGLRIAGPDKGRTRGKSTRSADATTRKAKSVEATKKRTKELFGAAAAGVPDA